MVASGASRRALTVLVVSALLLPVGSAAASPGGVEAMTITFCDVGQADASVVQAGGTAVLIDAGHWRRSDVLECLDDLGVEHLALFVATHGHTDHIGQAVDVLDHVQVDEVWRKDLDPDHRCRRSSTDLRRLGELLRPEDCRDASVYPEFDAEVERRAADGELRLRSPIAAHVATFGDLTVTVIHPDEMTPDDDGYDDPHDRGSIVVRIEAQVAGQDVASALFTGDVEAPVERRMVDDHPELLDADVYQVGHHGSWTSTSQELVDAGGFEYAVYSAATDSRYGHPHREPVQRLVDAGVTVYGTGEHGRVTATADGGGWSIDTETGAPPTQPDPGLLPGLLNGLTGQITVP